MQHVLHTGEDNELNKLKTRISTLAFICRTLPLTMAAPACGLGEDGDVLLHHHVAPHRAGVTLGPATAQYRH